MVFRACILFPLLILLSKNYVIAQTRTINRLKIEIAKAEKPEQKLEAVLALCDQGYSLHPDTLMYYAQKANSLATETHQPNSKVKALYYQSFSLTNKGLLIHLLMWQTGVSKIYLL